LNRAAAVAMSIAFGAFPPVPIHLMLWYFPSALSSMCAMVSTPTSSSRRDRSLPPLNPTFSSVASVICAWVRSLNVPLP
jgi:hypothetical protein